MVKVYCGKTWMGEGNVSAGNLRKAGCAMNQRFLLSSMCDLFSLYPHAWYLMILRA